MEECHIISPQKYTVQRLLVFFKERLRVSMMQHSRCIYGWAQAMEGPNAQRVIAAADQHFKETCLTSKHLQWNGSLQPAG
jgi:hypothetical protein